jgi:T-complex protein 1 subunit alpha
VYLLWTLRDATQGIDDTCMKYLVEAGVIGVRRCKKEDLRRIAVATGGVLLPNLADLEGEESFDPANLGIAEEVSEERVGDGTCARLAARCCSAIAYCWCLLWPR